MRAVCGQMVPQQDRNQPIDLAGLLDARLADGAGDGWRYAKMPPDPEMHQLGAAGFDQSAQAMFGCGFVQSLADQRDAVLRAVQEGAAAGEVWERMDAACYFEELLALLVDIYYSQPIAHEEIGYVGMADGHGWQAIGLNEREAHEPMAGASERGGP
jgi:hypothetical protein